MKDRVRVSRRVRVGRRVRVKMFVDIGNTIFPQSFVPVTSGEEGQERVRGKGGLGEE